MWNGHLGRTNSLKHHVKLLGLLTRLEQSAPSFFLANTCNHLRKSIIDQILRDNTIEPSQTEWALHIVIAPKNDSASFLSVKYQEVNPMSKP